MKLFSGKTFAQVYQESLSYLLANGDPNTAREKSSIELLNVGFEIEDPQSCLYTNTKRSSQIKYIANELLFNFCGRNDAEFISKHAKMWNNIKNSDGTVNSAYGYLLFKDKALNGMTQYEWALTSMVTDINTRQAVIHFNNSSHQYSGNRDFVCTMYGIFHIRQMRLNLSIFMRSNDAILGTPTDIPFFCSLQMQMHAHLKTFYPDLELGTYTHFANSYHIYDRHYQLTNDMLNDVFNPISINPINSDIIMSNGRPTEDILIMMKECETPEYSKKIIFQDRNDLLFWIWDNAVNVIH